VVKFKRWISQISRHRFFGTYVRLFVIFLVCCIYFLHENRYEFQVVIGDVISPKTKTFAKEINVKQSTFIATYRDKAPSMYIYSQGLFSGPLRLILEQAASKINYGVRWEQESLSASFTRLLSNNSDGRDSSNSIDIIPHLRSITSERDNLYLYSEPLGQQKRSIYLALRYNEVKTINGLSDLKGMNVGYQQGNHFNDEFQNTDDFNKMEYKSIKEMVEAFNRREVDVMVVSSKRSIEQGLTTIGARQVKYAKFTIDDCPELYFLYAKNPKNKELIAGYKELDKELLRMKEHGMIEDIFRSFSPVPIEKCSDDNAGEI
jgi:hypothetical protein